MLNWLKLCTYFVTITGTIYGSAPVFKYDNVFSQPPQKNDTSYFSSYKITHGLGVKITTQLKSLFPESKFSYDENSHLLFSKATKKQLKQIKSALTKLDMPVAQLKIEVSVVEINTQVFKEHKNLLSELSNGLVINYDMQAGKLKELPAIRGVFSQLVQEGRARVIAKPVITTLDNHPAHIKVGDRIPYVTTIIHNQALTQQLHHLNTGITLTITPHIISNNLIKTDISALVSSIKLWKTFQSTEYPVLSNRETQTTVFIQPDSTLIIAGLLDEQHKENITEVPILSSIPILGHLFRQVTKETIKSDVVFMITPHIL